MESAWQAQPASRAIASTVAESRPPESRTTADFTPRRASALAALRGEARAGLAGGFRSGETRDDVLERVARAARVALLGLDRGDREQRVGRLGGLRILREQLLLRGQRGAIVAHVGVADADPVVRVRGERARRIVLHEGAEGVDRGRKVVAAKEVRRRVVGLDLARLVLLGRRPWSGRIGARGKPYAGIHRRRRPGGGRAAFEALQPRIEVQVEIALALLHLLVLVAEDLELPAQARHLGVDLLELAHQLDHADVADALLEAGDARLVVEPLLHELLAQQLDAPSRLLVVVEPGLGRERDG